MTAGELIRALERLDENAVVEVMMMSTNHGYFRGRADKVDVRKVMDMDGRRNDSVVIECHMWA